MRPTLLPGWEAARGLLETPTCRDALVFAIRDPQAVHQAVANYSRPEPAPDGLGAVLEYVDRYRHLGAELIPVYPERTLLKHYPEAPGGTAWQLVVPDLSSPARELSAYHFLWLAPPENAGMLLENMTLEGRLAGHPGITSLRHPAIQYTLVPPSSRIGKLFGLALYDRQWGIKECGFPAVWKCLDRGGVDPGPVAVIDEGCYLGHPELKGRVRDIPPTRGKPSDATHASAVTAVLAARRDDGGMDGCCSANVHLYNVWTTEGFDCLAFYFALKAVAADPEVRVVNLSLFSVFDPLIKKQVSECIANGKILVAGMGETGNQDLIYPAAYCDMIAVGATTRQGLRFPKSNIGAHILLSAPGEYIYSAEGSAGYKRDNHGTSFATPMVSAAVWMALRQRPCWGRKEIEDLLSRSVVGNGTRSLELGFGRLDMVKLAAELNKMPQCP